MVGLDASDHTRCDLELFVQLVERKRTSSLWPQFVVGVVERGTRVPFRDHEVGQQARSGEILLAFGITGFAIIRFSRDLGLLRG